jgi:hypothetical protein
MRVKSLLEQYRFPSLDVLNAMVNTAHLSLDELKDGYSRNQPELQPRTPDEGVDESAFGSDLTAKEKGKHREAGVVPPYEVIEAPSGDDTETGEPSGTAEPATGA